MGKFCTNCGKELNENIKFCTNCGQENNAKISEVINNNVVNSNTSNQLKSKIAAGLLGIFLGGFGVHNFYLGYTGKAVAQLLITILSCGILSLLSSIWGLIEGIMILTGSINQDALGNPLGE